jgi:hypothetical protein
MVERAPNICIVRRFISEHGKDLARQMNRLISKHLIHLDK